MHHTLPLALTLPVGFGLMVADPLMLGPISIIPALGTLCLLGGAADGAIRRRTELLAFLIPVMLSELFAAVADAARGVWTETAALPAVAAFLLVELVMLGYLIRRCAGARLAAVALAVFCATYAMFAGFIGWMAFSDRPYWHTN